MNTTQAIEMYKRIERQGNALLSAYPQAVERHPVKLCKALLRLERQARRIATDYNNGDKTLEQAEKAVAPLSAKLRATLGDGPRVFVNLDSRGCAFKIRETDAARIPGIYRDMGGYGIIAPDLS